MSLKIDNQSNSLDYNPSRVNGFEFSKAKTKCTHFCQSRKMHLDPELTLDDVQIEVVPDFNNLGLLFDSKLSFILHISYLSNRCHKALNLLRAFSSMNWGADRKSFIKIIWNNCPFHVRIRVRLYRIWLSKAIVPSEVGFYPQPRSAISTWRF